MRLLLLLLCSLFKLRRKHIFTIIILCISLFYDENITAQVRINEVLAVNATFNYDKQFYNFSPWIELYNPSASSINLEGYYLTDSKKDTTKWAIPANTTIAAFGYITIWCDKKNTLLHTNYSIDTDGETILLYNPSLVLQDSMTLPKQYSNVSYGKISNGIIRGYMLTPTPNTSNIATSVSGQILPPTFSSPSGRYNSSLTLTLSHNLPIAKIRYTIDGSEPTTSSAIYTSPITIYNTTIVKAKAYTSLTLPSQTITQTYLINEHASTLPVLSVSMNPAFLTNDTIGIYVIGTNGLIGNCFSYPMNTNQDWGRYCVVEYFNPSGKSEFNKDFETKIYGACSRNYGAQKSLAFYARKAFGKGHLEYQLFPSKKIDRFDNFIIRNSGNDFNIIHFKDALMQEIVRTSFDIDYQAYQPAIVYLNGAYWGIMNIREKLNENYIEHNARVDADSIDYIETELRTEDSHVILGSNADYLEFKNQLQNMNLSDSSAFDYINSQIDVDECINYFIAEIYFKNTDWPGNNIKLWKSIKPGSKWRWMIFDTDFGFNDPTHSTLNFATNTDYVGDNWPNPPWSTLLFRLLISNPTFKQRFIQSFQTAISTTFNPIRVNNFIDSISGLIAAEMVYHKNRWGGNVANWNNNVASLKTFAQQRNTFMPGHIKTFFNITNPLLTFITRTSDPEMGAISLNNIVSSDNNTVQIYKNYPYSLKAIPKSGYKFKQWRFRTFQSSSEMLLQKGDTWKYHDLGQNLGTAWISESYNDAAWIVGTAQFGYGDGDERTTISYGSNSSAKYITYYFRRKVYITDTTGIKNYVMNLLCDDGAVIYINGTEIVRYNMPSGAISYNTLASAATENASQAYSINGNIFKPGYNTIAVEIHQNIASSSDLSFDMDLVINKFILESESVSTNQFISDLVCSNLIITADFEPNTPVSNLVINEVAPVRSRVKDNYGNPDDWFELYNAGSDTINLTGLYLTDNFNRKNKFEVWNNGSANTKIAPQGYYIFWADEEEHQGNNHISFKLDGAGEHVGIYQLIGKDTLVIDTVSFCVQKDLFSWGRCPDGTGTFQFLDSITAAYSNNYNCQAPNHLSKSEKSQIKVYPNPVSHNLYIELPENSVNATYTIYNSLGNPMIKGLITEQPINCANLKQGMYLLIINTENKRISQKIMIIE